MVTGIIGRKVGMTQVFDADGTVHPATVIKAGPCVVVQTKNPQTDGYEAVQLGFVEDHAPKANAQALEKRLPFALDVLLALQLEDSCARFSSQFGALDAFRNVGWIAIHPRRENLHRAAAAGMEQLGRTRGFRDIRGLFAPIYLFCHFYFFSFSIF